MEKLLTRHDLADAFQVTTLTIHRWEEAGIIKGIKILGKKYYSENQIKSLVKQKGLPTSIERKK